MSLTKLFNFNYAKQNIKRSIGFLAVLFIIIPLLSMAFLYNYANKLGARPFSLKEIIIPNLLGMFVLPFLLSNVLLGYVYSKKQIDFTNSMPISRKKIFFTNMLIGIIFIILMQAVTLLFSSIYLTISNTVYVSFEMLLDIFVALSIGYVFVFSVSMLALAISGNTFIQFVLILLILFLVPFIRISTYRYDSEVNFINADGTKYIFYTYLTWEQSVINARTGGTAWFLMPVQALKSVYLDQSIYNVKPMIATIVATIICMIIGNIAFQKKKMEAAGYSFQSTKVHMLVKIITLIPIIKIFFNILWRILPIQSIFIVILIFVYYYVYDLITAKKVKLSVTIVSFILSFVIIFGATCGAHKLENMYAEKGITIDYNDIEKLYFKLYIDHFGIEDNYEINKSDWNEIFDNLVYRDPYGEYENQPSYSVCDFALELKDGKTRTMAMYLKPGININMLKKVRNDEKYLEELCNKNKLGENTVIYSDYSPECLSLRDNPEIRDDLNKECSKEYLMHILDTEIKSYENEPVYNEETEEFEYKESNEYNLAQRSYMVCEYANHKQYAKTIYIMDGEQIQNIFIKAFNKKTKDDILNSDERYDDVYSPSTVLERYVGDGLYERGFMAKPIEADIEYIEFIKKDYENDFDSSKPFYLIRQTNGTYFTNDMEKINSIIDKYRSSDNFSDF